MKQRAELNQLNLDATAKRQVADMLQSLLEQVEQDAKQLQIKDNEIQQKDFKIQALTHELAHLRRIRFGVKNERLAPLQRDLFEDNWNSDQAAIEAEIEQLADDQPQGTAGNPKRPRAGRQPLPDHLPRIEHRHEPDSCQCGQCGKDLIKIGEDVTEQLDKELAHKRDKLKKLIKHHMAEHQKIDQADSYEAEQAKRIQQSIETLNKAASKIEKFLKNNEPRIGKGKSKKEVKSNVPDNDSAKMTTSKGTIQGYNGVATVDKKHQIVIDAQAFGAGPEQPTLQPILKTIKERYNRLKIKDDLYKTGAIITADTGFANEDNMEYLHTENINAYIPDNQFRSRDPKFDKQKEKYPRPSRAKPGKKPIIPASEFEYDPIKQTSTCPAGHTQHSEQTKKDKAGNEKIYFVGRVSHCRSCPLKSKCMTNPELAEQANGRGRQVSFILNKTGTPYTDWMKIRVDSQKGKQIYSHRMSVAEPVFGNITSNKGLKRFSVRGKTKVNAQWKLFCLIQNIEKLAN